jgi:hypothetical protein
MRFLFCVLSLIFIGLAFPGCAREKYPTLPVDILFEIVIFRLNDPSIDGVDLAVPHNLGVVPHGVIILRGGTNNALVNKPHGNGNMSVGFVDRNYNMWCVNMMLDADPGDQDTVRSQVDRMVSRRVQSAGNDGIKDQYKINPKTGFTATHINIQSDLVDTPMYGGGPYWCAMIVIGGDNIESLVVGHTSLGTGTAPVPVSIGRRPHLVFKSTIHHKGLHADGPTWRESGEFYTDGSISFGVMIDDGSDSQACISWGGKSNSATADNSTALYTNRLMASIAHRRDPNYTVVGGRFNSDGWTETPSGTASNHKTGHMAITFKVKPKMKIVPMTIPTDADISITGAGHGGGFALLALIGGQLAYNTVEQNDMSAAISAIDRSTIGTINVTSEHGEPNDGDGGTVGVTYDRLGMIGNGGSVGKLPAAAQVTSTSHGFNADGLGIATSVRPSAKIIGWGLLLEANPK